MKVQTILARINEEKLSEAASLYWNESMAEYPDGGLSFLSDQAVADNWKQSGFEESLPDSVLETARLVRGDPALSRLAWHGFWRLYLGPEHPDTNGFPSLERALGAHSGEFYLLLAMAMAPLVAERHRSLGISEDVTRETCLQVKCHCGNYRNSHDGRYGICLRQLHWHRHYVKNLLFRLGRFEYMGFKAPLGMPYVYRHRKNGQVVALVGETTQLTGNGYVAREPDMPAVWTANIEWSDDAVSGYPISSRGFVIRERMRLPLAEWDCVLKEGDSALQMHIPAGGSMTPEACGESLRKAPAFFRRYFPDHPVAAVICNSWIFNNQLQEILPADSNLVQLQKEVYLFPVPGGPRSGLWFIFLTDDLDPQTTPRRTSLQRAVWEFISVGNPWRSGGMFILADDVERFGTQHYLRGLAHLPFNP